MWKIIKIILLIPLVLIVLGIGWFIVRESSQSFATNIAYLSCVLKDANDLNEDDPKVWTAVKKAQRNVIHGNLRRDWIKGQVLLNWVARDGEEEDGLGDTRVLNISTKHYSGRDGYGDEADYRSIDRETLVYRLTVDGNYWIDRQCSKVSKAEYENKRKASEAATKAKQNI